MNILISGASGFLGRHIYECLAAKNNIDSIGRREVDTFRCDLSVSVPNIKSSYDLVVHCAGKAHIVPKTEAEKQLFFDLNFKGTLNLLKGFTAYVPKALVFISTVAVYGKETGACISETHSLEGHTPYAVSKIQAEKAVLEWGKENGVAVLVLRLPLIAGVNPPGNLGKMISGIKRGHYLSIANGKSRRSMVLAEDVAQCILENFGKSGVYNLTDGYHPSFREIEKLIADQLSRPLPKSIPMGLAKLVGKIGDVIPGSPVNSLMIEKMISDLTYDDSKARKELNWNPRRIIDHFKI